ncbi:glucoamylase family protein [Actinopolymorpha alba]|uniref:glucoamylase family protein n=1 Tax=Actinopolymorpha alba TaxID=533267 RepID=UPI000376B15A|nr:glucoamylase family protein [Actinopolymorpha alba]
MRRRRRLVRALLALAVTTAAMAGSLAAPATAEPTEKATLMRYAKDTWKSFVAMVDPATGLPADNIGGSLAASTRSAYTSPTNIGGYLWSTVIARDLGIIGARDAQRRVAQTLDTLARLDHHERSGMYYNWYDPQTGAVLRKWPDSGDPIQPFLSSVDNGWLAASFMVVRTAMPGSTARKAEKLLAAMDFGVFYNPNPPGQHNAGGGLIHGGFIDEPGQGCHNAKEYKGSTIWMTCHHYDVFNTEARIASYIGIARGQIPREHYFGANRTFPASCDWSWMEQKPVGFNATYLGVQVFEGAYQYRGMRFVPSWGGDMFEALMPAMFVPEEKWGKRSWGVNHPLYVRGQIEHGLKEAGYGYWGFSPASNPNGGYAVYGVDELGMDPGGYPSDLEATNVDRGFEGCRDAQPMPSFGDGVVTPHASFLALPYARGAAVANLTKLERDLDSYGPGGFYDAIAVKSGRAAQRYLSLDQAMVLGPIGNALLGDRLRAYFSHGEAERNLAPLMGMERFNAGAAD